MSRYVAGRLAEIVPVVLLVSIAAFALVHLVPGDPARANLPVRATADQIAARQQQLGLDRPLPTQFGDFLSGAVHFDFGNSFSLGDDEPVSDVIERRAGPSLLLVGYSLVLSLVLAVPLATVAAIRRGRAVDRVIQVLPTLTFVMPVFWLALLLVNVFSLQLGLLPTSGYGETFAEHLRSLTLPAVTMALGLFPVLLRLLRSSMIDTMQSEHVEAARARGLSDAHVVLKHVLRNSLTSTLTLTSVLVGLLLSSTVVVEQIFSIPGLGSLVVSSVQSRDYPTVQALALLFGLAVPLISLVTDLLYAVLDPRVRL